MTIGEDFLTDVAPHLNGDHEPSEGPLPGVPGSWLPRFGDSEEASAPTPALLEIQPDLFLFYEGFVNGLYGASETFKTWLALTAVKEKLEQGGAVLFLDFEQSRDSVISRLHQMGLAGEGLDRFGYMSPTEPLPQLHSEDHAAVMDHLRSVLGDGLAVVDGTTEAMGLHDLDVNSNKDVTRFEHLLLKPLVRDGGTVVLIHHVGNSEKDRAVGAQQFKSMIGGAAYITDQPNPPTATTEGAARLKIHKDRHGGVRSRLNGDNVGTLKFNPHSTPTTVSVEVLFYTSRGEFEERDARRVYETVCRLFEESGKGSTKNVIEGNTQGKAATNRHALNWLARHGAVEKGEPYRGSYPTFVPGPVPFDEAISHRFSPVRGVSVQTVRLIEQLSADGVEATGIANELNIGKHRRPDGKPWTAASVEELIRHAER